MLFNINWLILLLVVVPLILHASADEEPNSMPDTHTAEASNHMLAFALRTGLAPDSDQPPQRYLWTDTFAVCNYFGLARVTGEKHYKELALRLIDQVHHVLGRHRDDDPRSGWISGLAEQEGRSHPARGGLRIGKRLPERGGFEPFDEHLEWERDGQYFHYLTRWMHALDQASRETGDPQFNSWARELAATAHDAFTYIPSHGRVPRMYWKMSIDLTRPLVSSMGQHDPVDGYITALQLSATAARLPQPNAGPDLGEAIHQYAAMANTTGLASADPLGIGGLLVDAYRVAQLIDQGGTSNDNLPVQLLDAALTGLEHYARSGELQAPADYRLAFRELGLAIGLHAVDRMQDVEAVLNPESRNLLERLMRYMPIAEEIETFWRKTENREVFTWTEHRDINEVMLATSLAPDGYLVLSPDSESGRD